MPLNGVRSLPRKGDSPLFLTKEGTHPAIGTVLRNGDEVKPMISCVYRHDVYLTFSFFYPYFWQVSPRDRDGNRHKT
jgi:hypothetical protein